MNLTNFFDTLTPTPDQTLLPNVWLTWETKTKGRIFMNCATGEQQRNSESWMPYKNYYITYEQLRQPSIVVTSGSTLRFAYSKYHESAKLLELAAVEFNTNRTGGAREWKFAEGGNRYFITEDKQIYASDGTILNDGTTAFHAYRSHSSYRFKDFISYIIRLNAHESFTTEFKKLLGSNMFIGKNGRASEAKYAWSVYEWYTTSNTKKTSGKTQQLLDKLASMTKRDLTDICHIHGICGEHNEQRRCVTEVKNIIVYEQLNDEWSVLRYCYRDSNDNNTESYRAYISEHGECKLAKLNTNHEWVPAQNQNYSWSPSYGRIINLDEATTKSKRLSYIIPVIHEMPETRQFTALTLMLKHPELEKLYKMGYHSLASKLMTDSTVNANIMKYIGETHKHSKTLFSEWGVNKYQLERLNESCNTLSYRRNHRSIAELKKFYDNDISSLDNETFDRLDAFMTKLLNHNLEGYLDTLVGADVKPWLNHVSRIFDKSTDVNLSQILADTVRMYKNITPTNRPEVNWHFDSASDITRAHDAVLAIKLREDEERRRFYNLDQAERAKKLDEKRKKIDETRKHYEYEDDNFIIRLPKDNQEIIYEGSRQHICIAGYVNSHSDGTTNLFFLRKKSEPDTPFYAIELHNNHVITQIHGFGNKWLGNNPEVIPTVIRWIRKHALMCDTKVLTCTATGYSSYNATCVPLPTIED